MKKLYPLLFFFFCAITNCFGQLSDFTLSVTPTAATCLGNGALTITTTGTNPEATVNFTLYLLPNLVTPIATTPSTSLTGLNPGNYKVIALQTLGALNNSQEQEVTVANQIPTLNYNLTGTNANCLGGGTITANIISGNPATYQIISGPVTTPLQTTNIFSNLPPGNYNVRVIDTCGQGVVRSITIIEIISNPNAITILQNEFPDVWASEPNPHCDSIRVGHRIQILTGSNVVSPLQFVFTVFPPDGSPAVTVTHSITVLPNEVGVIPNVFALPFSFTIPYYESSYNYNLELIDGCGNSYYRNNNNVNKYFNFNFSSSPSSTSCGFNLRISPRYFKLPLTVEFISAPAGFNPSLFSAQHPTFNTSNILYQAPNGAPGGTYVVKVTDACGREATNSYLVEDNVIAVSGYFYINCNEIIGNVVVPSRQIVAANFIQVPANSGITLPYDLSSFIQPNGTVVITGILSVGTYVISVTDSCGKVHTVTLIIVPQNITPLFTTYYNGCGQDFGSVILAANNTPLISSTFISGPATYQPGFPHDVSENLSNGIFSMNSLPVGIYVIRTVDTCGNIRNNTLFIGGYFSTTEIEIFRFCSSFDLFVSHTHNNSLPNNFLWLQRENPITGAWEHPTLGGTYIENTIPNATNAKLINNNQLNINVGDGGHYRMIVITTIAPNGNDAQNLNCINIVKEFDVEGTTVVNSILNFACSNTISDVYLDVSGTGPFDFTILEKNGLPFVVENGEDPLFTNLETGIYKFQIEDDCGNLTVRIHDVFAPVVFAITPTLCIGQYSTLSVPNFPYLEYEWFKQGSENIIITTNPIMSINALNFNIHSGIYYVNISYPPNPDSCLNRMLSFEITPEMAPNAGNDFNTFICNPPDAINLNSYLSGNFDENGTWEQINPDGSLNVNVWSLENVQNGIYQFKYIVNGLCGFTDEAVVTLEILNQIPTPEIVTINSICAGNDINLSVTNGGNTNFSYSWTGPNNFTSTDQNPTIINATNAMSGIYNLTVTAGNCQAVSSVEVSINSLPDFIFATETIVICEGQNTQIEVIPASVINVAYEYVWYLNNQEIIGENTSIIEISQAGTYSVVISSGDCSIIKTINVTENTTLFEVGITAGCQNDFYIISAVAVDNSFDETTASYLWSGPDNFASNDQSADITNLTAGIYSVIVTDIGGCSVETSVVVNGTRCKIPNAISPNGDGLNDAWDLSGFDIEKIKIFNRWGREVYEEHRYQNQWHGQNQNGKMLPSGTYFYHIRFTSGEEVAGWVFLSR